jgi:hypothetical protein
MQTFWASLSLILRVVLLGIALPLLLGDFPGYSVPRHPSQEWILLTGCDALAVAAPLIRWRKVTFLAGVATLGTHYFYHPHAVPVWDLAYVGVAIVLTLMPASGRSPEMVKREQNRRR